MAAQARPSASLHRFDPMPSDVIRSKVRVEGRDSFLLFCNFLRFRQTNWMQNGHQFLGHNLDLEQGPRSDFTSENSRNARDDEHGWVHVVGPKPATHVRSFSLGPEVTAAWSWAKLLRSFLPPNTVYINMDETHIPLHPGGDKGVMLKGREPKRISRWMSCASVPKKYRRVAYATAHSLRNTVQITSSYHRHS